MYIRNDLTGTARTALVAALLGLSAVVHADLGESPSGTYVNDPAHSYLTFSYSHFGLSNPQLAFDDFSVELKLDSADVAKSSLSVSIDPDSVVAGSDIWKEHLTGGDFLDVANYDEITFTSTSIEAAEEGHYTVTGDLTIKETTAPVTLSVRINAATAHPMTGAPVIGLSADGELKRSDFGLDKLVPNVSDEVTIHVTTELSLQD